MYLILEDSQEFAAILYQRLPDHVRNNIIWTQTAEDCISVLKDYKTSLELVSLDFELGGLTGIDYRRPDCGMEVIRWFEKQDPREWNHLVINIHSLKTPANKIMQERLNKAGYTNVTVRSFAGTQ